jgi:hypothetical protein
MNSRQALKQLNILKDDESKLEILSYFVEKANDIILEYDIIK